MKTVMLMRHAKSDWSIPDLDDHDRPLNKRGKRDAPEIARYLNERGLVPDLILSSSATRAVRTASAIAVVCGCNTVTVDSHLYHATPEEWHLVLNQQPPVSILLAVGHNPGLEELLLDVTGEYHPFKTGSIARLEFEAEGSTWDANWNGTCEMISPRN